MQRSIALSVLLALFDLARAGRRADVGLLAGRLGAHEDVVRLALTRLDRLGFADSKHVRLTLTGLALAVNAAEQREDALALLSTAA